jgi:hypothetical protein
MPALYSHTTRADGLVLTASIYNADHVNHITNGIPAQLDDYSSNAVQMQTTADPGEVGTESLATSLAGELERSRFMLKELGSLMQGSTLAQWYTSVVGNRRMLISIDAFTSSDTWTKPSGCNAALVIVVAGGAGGGSANAGGAAYAAGGGGGSGGMTIDFITSGLGSTETVTVGAGGAAEVAGSNTSFGSHVTADGGAAGSGAANGSGAGGYGGLASATGLVGFAGTDGTDGLALYGPNAMVGGVGGSGAVSGNASGAGTGGAGSAGVCLVLNYT